jgi:hypothetical protein
MEHDAFDSESDDPDDFDDMNDEAKPNEEGRPIVRHVVRDLGAAVKMRKVQQRTEMLKIKAEERRRRMELKMDLAMRRMSMSAGEKARAHIAVAGPFYLLLLIGGFLILMTTDALPDESVSVAASIITLLITGIMTNLRTIVTSNGKTHEDGLPEPAPAKSEPAPAKRKS